MRVLVVTPSYPGPDSDVSGIFVHRQVRHLVRLGVECRVVRFSPGPPGFPRWLVRRTWVRHYWRRIGWRNDVDGIPTYDALYRRTWSQGEDVVPAIGEALVRLVERHPELRETDVVYAHWLWPSGAAALALRDRFGWPVAAIARGGDLQHWLERNPHCRPYVEQVLESADAVLANCEYLRDRAEVLAPGARDRMRVVYNGCDLDVFRQAPDRAAARRAAGFGDEARMLLFVGALAEHKGARELAAAWERFAPAHPAWSLVVAGRADEPGLADALERRGHGRVRLMGQIGQQRIVELLQVADGYVQPSHNEGLSNATMEAMAVGLPVVTTDAGGQRELIRDGENGWVVPTRDAGALAAALAGLASDPERAARFGRAARRTIEDRFDPRKEAETLASILGELARRPAIPRPTEEAGAGAPR
jgi:glycosyltransferase involved in cell wall biosynthesis